MDMTIGSNTSGRVALLPAEAWFLHASVICSNASLSSVRKAFVNPFQD
jgi:hypothetical protein